MDDLYYQKYSTGRVVSSGSAVPPPGHLYYQQQQQHSVGRTAGNVHSGRSSSTSIGYNEPMPHTGLKPTTGTGGIIYPGPPIIDSADSFPYSSSSQHHHHSAGNAPATTSAPPPIPPPPSQASTLEKYFTREELKRFNEYNRFLIMSSPGRQKKFYSSLSNAEYKRFNDYLDMESKSKEITLVTPANMAVQPTTSTFSPSTPKPNVPMVDSMYSGDVGSMANNQYQSSYSYSSAGNDSSYGSYKNDNHSTSTITNNSNSNNSSHHRTGIMPSMSQSEYFSSPSGLIVGRVTNDIAGKCTMNTGLVGGGGGDHFISDYPDNMANICYAQPTTGGGYSNNSVNKLSDPISSRRRNIVNSRSRTPQNLRYGKSSSSYRSSTSSAKNDSRRLLSRSGEERKSPGRKRPPSPPKSGRDSITSKNKKVKILEERIKELEKKIKKNDESALSMGRSRSRDRSSDIKSTGEKTPLLQRSAATDRKRPAGTSSCSNHTSTKKEEPTKKTKVGTDQTKTSVKKPKTETTKTTLDNKEKIKNKTNENKVPELSSTMKEKVAMKNYKIPKKNQTTAAAAKAPPAKESTTEKKPQQPTSKSSSTTRKQSPSLKKSEKPSTASSRSSTSNFGSKSSKRTRSRSPIRPLPERPKNFGRLSEAEIEKELLRFQWCNLCHEFYKTSEEYLQHVHRDKHYLGLGSSDFYIIRKAVDKINQDFQLQEQQALKTSASTSSANSLESFGSSTTDSLDDNASNQFLGNEFLYPLVSFYCDLCAKFLPTSTLAQEHLHSERHLSLYKKYTKKNVEFYKKFNNSRLNEFRSSAHLRRLQRNKMLNRYETPNSGSGKKDDKMEQQRKPSTSSSANNKTKSDKDEIKDILDSILHRVIKNLEARKKKTNTDDIKIQKSTNESNKMPSIKNNGNLKENDKPQSEMTKKSEPSKQRKDQSGTETMNSSIKPGTDSAASTKTIKSTKRQRADEDGTVNEVKKLEPPTKKKMNSSPKKNANATAVAKQKAGKVPESNEDDQLTLINNNNDNNQQEVLKGKARPPPKGKKPESNKNTRQTKKQQQEAAEIVVNMPVTAVEPESKPIAVGYSRRKAATVAAVSIAFQSVAVNTKKSPATSPSKRTTRNSAAIAAFVDDNITMDKQQEELLVNDQKTEKNTKHEEDNNDTNGANGEPEGDDEENDQDVDEEEEDEDGFDVIDEAQ